MRAGISEYMARRTAETSHTVRRAERAVHLTLRGQFDIAVRSDLDRWLTEATDGLSFGGELTLDLRFMTFCDAGCVAILARHYYRLTGMSVQVGAVGVQPMVAKVFRILGLGQMLAHP